MKRFFLTIALALIAFIGTYAQETVVWEQPVIGYTNYKFFEVQKVELAKDRTSLYMQITYPPNSWFRFSPQSYIEADGKRYEIIGSDSIELGKYAYTSPETRKKDFVLHFQPLPQNTKVFDMLESTQKGDFTFYFIHPNDYEIVTPVPADFRADYPLEETWPENVFGEEPATVHFKVLNYKKGMELKIDATYFDITDPDSRDKTPIHLDDEGCADYSCKVYYPSFLNFTMQSSSDFSHIQTLVAPGQEVTILLDMLRNDTYPKTKVIGYKGYYAKFDKVLEELRIKSMETDGSSETSYTPNPYMTCKTVSDFAALHDSLMAVFHRNTSDRQAAPDITQTNAQDYERTLFYQLYNVNETLFNQQEFRDYFLHLHPKGFFDNNLRIEGGFKVIAKLFAGTEEKGFAPNLFRFIHSMSELNSGNFNPKPLLDDPNLSRLYDQKRQEIAEKNRQRAEGLTANIHYLELTDVAPDNTLQFLLNRYKGKTIFLDIWATWCAPCRMGHQAMEPVKEELKDKDIVYLYITCSQSPFDEWKEIIKNIPGEHYYLSPEQFNELGRLYGIGAIPTYAIYNSNGELVYKQVGFSQAEPLKAGLMKALEQVPITH